MKKYNCVILGYGAREDALEIALDNSPHFDQVTLFDKGDQVCHFDNDENLLVFAGSESFLYDPPHFKHEIPIYPYDYHAHLELSKSYCRNLMVENSIPGVVPHIVLALDGGTLRYGLSGTTISREYLKMFLYEYSVIKPDGLTGGKGVKIVGRDFDIEGAVDYCHEIKDQYIVLEKQIIGQEFSLMAFCDGKHILNTIPIQDHKRRNEGDSGPNTGGMGAISNYDNGSYLLPFLTQKDYEKACDINRRVFEASNKAEMRCGYKGILYGSFIKTDNGEIYVIEYNVRFGDPECINLLSVLKTDLGEIFIAMAEETLDKIQLEYKPVASVTKYLVPRNYPYGECESVDISNIFKEEIIDIQTCNIRGYSDKPDNVYIGSVENGKTTNSRALCVVGTGPTIYDAHLQAEEVIECLNLDMTQFHYRKDIGTAYGNPTRNKCKKSRAEERYYLDPLYTSDHDKNEQLMGKISRFLPQTGKFAGNFAIELLSTTDGVGTKTIVAKICDNYKNLGRDIVGHCLNDLLVQGCTMPLFMLDYIASHDTNVDLVKDIVKTISEECQRYGCSLVGGETAEMRDIYREGMIDLVGMAVGYKTMSVESDLVPGDIVYGLPSNGFHTNGYTLLRSILTEEEIIKYGDYLLQPHKCYLDDIKLIIQSQGHNSIKRMCHITGGGFFDNPKRILGGYDAIELDRSAIFGMMDPTMKEILDRIDDDDQKLRTFNCGVGFLVIASPESNFDRFFGLKPIGKIIHRTLKNCMVNFV